MKKLVVLIFLTAVFFGDGCGIVGVMSTPGRGERKIPAEYDLSKHLNKKMLILVNQPLWLNADVNLRYSVTKSIAKSLEEKVKFLPENLISYDKLSEYRSSQNNFTSLSAVEIGKALGADLVLLVTIDGYELNEIAQMGYYKGLLGARVILFEVSKGQNVWPVNEESKSLKVGFEVEKRGREVAVSRLEAALVYCITRYFYDCRKDRFKIADDMSGIGWKDWQ